MVFFIKLAFVVSCGAAVGGGLGGVVPSLAPQGPRSPAPCEVNEVGTNACTPSCVAEASVAQVPQFSIQLMLTNVNVNPGKCKCDATPTCVMDAGYKCRSEYKVKIKNTNSAGTFWVKRNGVDGAACIAPGDTGNEFKLKPAEGCGTWCEMGGYVYGYSQAGCSKDDEVSGNYLIKVGCTPNGCGVKQC